MKSFFHAQDIRRRINEFLGRLRQEIGDDLEEDEARLRGKWNNYEGQIDLFRWIVDVALEVKGNKCTILCEINIQRLVYAVFLQITEHLVMCRVL